MAEVQAAQGPDPIDVQVGITIRQFRKTRGISQSELGAASGITFQQIQKYDRGVNRISASMLVRAAMVLDVQPSELLPRTDAKPITEGAQAVAFVRGAQEVAETYAAIRSPSQRKALLALIRAMGAADPAAGDLDDDGLA